MAHGGGGAGKRGEEAESLRKALVFWPASEGNVFFKKKVRGVGGGRGVVTLF